MSDKIQFLGIGAPRSGTTWLYDRLAEHPDFQLLRIKELHYFDRSKDYLSPNELSEDRFMARLGYSSWRRAVIRSCWRSLKNRDSSEFNWMLKFYFPSKYNDQWYLSLFDGLDGIRGEITPAYMLLDDTDVERVYSLFPNLKTIFLMRDPIERTWSSYRKNYLRKGRTLPDIDSMIAYLDSPEITQRLNYLETLARYKKYSQPHKILIGFLDAIVEQPLATLEGVVTFLSGDVEKIGDHCKLNTVSNASPSLDIPDAIKEHLCLKYHPLMKELSDRFGGYCNRWMHRHFDTTVSDEPVQATFLLDDR